MKKSLPATLFLLTLIGLSGVTTAKAAIPEQRFSVECRRYDTIIYHHYNVSLPDKSPLIPYQEFKTDDNRRVIIDDTCVFIQRLSNDYPQDPSKAQTEAFPEDGEQRYAIGH